MVVHNFSLCIGSIVSGARIHTSSLDTGPCTLALRFQETLAVSPALCRPPEVAPPWHWHPHPPGRLSCANQDACRAAGRDHPVFCFCSQVTWIVSGNIEEREQLRVYLPASFINTDSCTRYHGDQKWSLPTSSSGSGSPWFWFISGSGSPPGSAV